MPLTSSQGNAYGIAGATKVTIKKTRSTSDNKLDASTLSLAHGADRVYEDGLADNGPSGEGITVTVAVEFLGDTAPAVGSTNTFGGVLCKCIDAEISNEAGALVKGVANFTSDYT